MHDIQVICMAKASITNIAYSTWTSIPFSKILSLHQICISWSLLSDGNGHMTKPELHTSLNHVRFHCFHHCWDWNYLRAMRPVNLNLQFLNSKVKGSHKKLCLKKPKNVGLVLTFIFYLHTFSFIPSILPCSMQVHCTHYPRHPSIASM